MASCLLGAGRINGSRVAPTIVGDHTYVVMAYIVMAYVVMAYIVMTYIVMTYIVMAYVVMAYVVMAYVVMAYVVMAYIVMAVSQGLLGSAIILAIVPDYYSVMTYYYSIMII